MVVLIENEISVEHSEYYINIRSNINILRKLSITMPRPVLYSRMTYPLEQSQMILPFVL